MSLLKYQALNAKYEAEILEAKAILEVYFNNSVGVGEHPQVLDEMDKQIQRVADAHGKIEALNHFVVLDDPKSNPEGEEE